jgi:hypothetical protein
MLDNHEPIRDSNATELSNDGELEGRMKRISGLALSGLLVAAMSLAACGKDDKTSVAFASPKDGAKVTSPVKVEMTAKGITIEPAGEIHKDAGHFHIAIDTPCVKKGLPIPTGTAGYQHFGKAQTSAELTLTPGHHKLCLQVGNGAHIALEDTKTITVNVTG